MSKEISTQCVESLRSYNERRRAAAALRRLELEEKWRAVATEAFVQKCIRIYKQLPGCDFPDFVVELNIPNAPVSVKRKVCRQIQDVTTAFQSNPNGDAYCERLKAVISKARAETETR